MPKGVKPPASFKGNKNSGRKTKAEEFAFVLAKEKEKFTDEMLLSKAKAITNGVLDKMGENGIVSLESMKGVVMPLTLKGLTEKVEVTGRMELQTLENTVRDIANDKDTTIGEPALQE